MYCKHQKFENNFRRQTRPWEPKTTQKIWIFWYCVRYIQCWEQKRRFENWKRFRPQVMSCVDTQWSAVHRRISFSYTSRVSGFWRFHFFSKNLLSASTCACVFLSPPDRFSWNLTLEPFTKIHRKIQIWLKSDKYIGHYTCEPKDVDIVDSSRKYFVSRQQ